MFIFGQFYLTTYVQTSSWSTFENVYDVCTENFKHLCLHHYTFVYKTFPNPFLTLSLILTLILIILITNAKMDREKGVYEGAGEKYRHRSVIEPQAVVPSSTYRLKILFNIFFCRLTQITILFIIKQVTKDNLAMYHNLAHVKLTKNT